MSSVPWSNETERADYYKKLYNYQLAICDRLEKENEQLKAEIERLKAEIEGLKIANEVLFNARREQDTVLEKFEKLLDDKCDRCIVTTKAEAAKEFAEKLVFEIFNKPSEFNATQATHDFLNGMAYRQDEIIDIIKEMESETNV